MTPKMIILALVPFLVALAAILLFVPPGEKAVLIFTAFLANMAWAAFILGTSLLNLVFVVPYKWWLRYRSRPKM